MSNIILKVEHRQAIAKHGEAAYPRECRGLLLGHRNGMTREVVDIFFSNEPTKPEAQEYHFYVPGQERGEGEEVAKAKGLEVLGSFHSYVDRPAKPSINDGGRAEATFSYVIVGIREGRAHELTAWQLSEDRSAFMQEVLRSS